MLTDSERQQLDEQGYLALPGLMSPQVLEALRQRVEELSPRKVQLAVRSLSRSRARGVWPTW
jgi:hypothetical protein